MGGKSAPPDAGPKVRLGYRPPPLTAARADVTIFFRILTFSTVFLFYIPCPSARGVIPPRRLKPRGAREGDNQVTKGVEA
eukprot:scaffold89223_cov79-Phaeocystis_antarctica.AAC.3